jgi:hypothetical protein
VLVAAVPEGVGGLPLFVVLDVVLIVLLLGCGRFSWGLLVTVFPRRGVAVDVVEDALAVLAVVEALVATGGFVVDGTGVMVWMEKMQLFQGLEIRGVCMTKNAIVD